MPTQSEIATLLTLRILEKTGVQEWDDTELLQKITVAANFMAAQLAGSDLMAMPDYFKVEPGTAKTFKSSAGDAAITLASLANDAARQAVTLDLGANWAQLWRIDTDFEMAATPTAKSVIRLHASFGNATGAGKGNTSGTDAAYTGYSSNIDDSLAHLTLIGLHVCTAQATATVQKAIAGMFRPTGRYMNLVVYDKSGAAFHSSDTNCVITVTPLEELVQEAV